MKLAEALNERTALRGRIEELKQRIYRNALVQEGEAPSEGPAELLAELAREVELFATLATRINVTNTRTQLPDGMPLVEALARRDMLHLQQLVHENLANKATPEHDRYSKREIKLIASVNVIEIRRRRDELARAARLLDLEVQQLNWAVDLL